MDAGLWLLIGDCYSGGSITPAPGTIYPKSLACSGGSSIPSPPCLELPQCRLCPRGSPPPAASSLRVLKAPTSWFLLSVSPTSPGTTQEYFAQNIPGFINLVWLAYYISSGRFPLTRNLNLTTAICLILKKLLIKTYYCHFALFPQSSYLGLQLCLHSSFCLSH